MMNVVKSLVKFSSPNFPSVHICQCIPYFIQDKVYFFLKLMQWNLIFSKKLPFSKQILNVFLF